MIDFTNGSVFKLKNVPAESLTKEISPLIIAGESVVGTYKTVRDFVVFTDKRIIAVNVQGVTGKKKDYTFLPYSKIQAFSIETAGIFDMDSELELYFSGLGKVRFEFTGQSGIIRIGQLISEKIL